MPPPTRRRPAPPPAAPVRPLLVPFAAFFGLLVAAEDLYLGWLLWEPGAGWDPWLVVPVVLAGWALTGSVLVLAGRARGALVLAGAALLPLLGLLGLVLFFGALGGGRALWAALLLLAGPVGCLLLTLRRPVREWTSPRRARTGPVARGR